MPAPMMMISGERWCSCHEHRASFCLDKEVGGMSNDGHPGRALTSEKVVRGLDGPAAATIVLILSSISFYRS